jgi:hypothetical protein
MIITSGGTVLLNLVFVNGTGVITPGDLPVASGIPLSVSPTGTTSYTLTVTNSAGVTVTQDVGITVVPAGAAMISPDEVQASGAQQTNSGSGFTNGVVLGEPFPASLTGTLSGTLTVRDDFLPPNSN